MLKKTITSIFILPSLKLDREKLLLNGFITSFSYDDVRNIHDEDLIHIILNPNDKDFLTDFIDSEFEQNELLLEDIYHANGLVQLVYKLRTEFTDDYLLVKQGKYSKTSQKYQSLFPKVIKITKNGKHSDEVTLQWNVFRKATHLKEMWEELIGCSLKEDQEVWEGFKKGRETLTEEKLQKISKDCIQSEE